MDTGPQQNPRLEELMYERRQRDLVNEAALRRQRREHPGVIRRALKRAWNAIARRD